MGSYLTLLQCAHRCSKKKDKENTLDVYKCAYKTKNCAERESQQRKMLQLLDI